MKNFSLIINGSINYSNITDPYICKCSCGVLSDNFLFGAINLFLVATAFLFWNRYIYTKRYSLNEINYTEDNRTLSLWLIDKIFIALLFLNLASVFFALTLPVVFLI